MNKLIAIGGIGLTALLGPQTASASDLISKLKGEPDMRSRIIYGSSQGSLDPISLYKGVIQAIQEYNHDKAATLCEKIISYGPANNPKYKEASYQIRVGIWKDITTKYPTIMDAERASAHILLDKAEKLEAHDPQAIEYRQQAKKYTQSVLKREQELKRAIRKLRGTQ